MKHSEFKSEWFQKSKHQICDVEVRDHKWKVGQAPHNTWSRAQKVVKQIWSRYEQSSAAAESFSCHWKPSLAVSGILSAGLFLEAGYFWQKNPSLWMVAIKKLQDNSAVVKRDGVYLFNVTSILRIKCESQNLSFFFVRQKMDWFRFWKIYDCIFGAG